MRRRTDLTPLCRAPRRALLIVVLLAPAAPVGGVAFDDPEALNSNAAIDAEADVGPHVATDGAGRWLTVWHSFDPLPPVPACPGTELLCSADTECQGQVPAGICREIRGTCLGSDLGCAVDADCDRCVFFRARKTCLGTEIECSDDEECKDTLPFGFCGAQVPDECADTGRTCRATRDCEVCVDAEPERVCLGSELRCTSDAECQGQAPAGSCDRVGRCAFTSLACRSDLDCERCVPSTTGRDADVVVARSEDAGGSWSEPRVVNLGARIDASNELWPRVATDGRGLWMVVWQSDATPDSKVLLARSLDAGETFGPPVRLQEAAGVSSQGAELFPELATDGQGRWLAAWQKSLPGSAISDVVVVRSLDDGLTWSEVARMDAGDDASPRLATDRRGRWLLVWDARNPPIGGDRDVFVSRSEDDGATWSAPEPLHPNAGIDVGADTRPQVATDRRGRWVVIWESSDSLEGQLGGRCPGTGAPCDGDADCVGAIPEGTCSNARCGGTVLACQTDLECERCVPVTLGFDTDVLAVHSDDGGLTWSSPTPVNTNAAADVAADLDPSLTTDTAGTWLAAWVSRDPLADRLVRPIGSDLDVVTASSPDGELWCGPFPLHAQTALGNGADQRPQVITDERGLWLVVWDTTERVSPRIARDSDIGVAVGHTAADDADADGIPDVCECGDFDGNGRVNTSDARLIQRCAVEEIPCAGLCDVTGEGACNTSDARLVQRLAVGQISKQDLRCRVRPSPP